MPKYLGNHLSIWGIVLEVQRLCFNEFPDKCVGCPDYREYRQDLTTQLILQAGTGFIYPMPYAKVVKECKLYHKRKIEYDR
jgi:hypothetical protein